MLNQCYIGDCIDGLKQLANTGIRAQTCVTSPPYWGLRDYGHPGAFGLEQSPAEYIERMVSVFRAVREVLTDDGTLWLNMGDSYFSPRTSGGDRGNTSSINGKGTQAAYKQAHRQWQPHRQQPSDKLKSKDLVGMPWEIALALRADGWWLRQDIIWHKPNAMPESAKDRCTKAHEYLFLLSKSERYYFDADAIAEPASPESHSRAALARKVGGWAHNGGSHSALEHNTRHQHPKTAAHGSGIRNNRSFSEAVTDVVPNRNRRSVWTIPTEPYAGAHFATFPKRLIEPCILAGSRQGDVVLDPFMGTGTTAAVAAALGRQWVGFEINPDYVAMQADRLRQNHLDLPEPQNATDRPA